MCDVTHSRGNLVGDCAGGALDWSGHSTGLGGGLGKSACLYVT